MGAISLLSKTIFIVFAILMLLIVNANVSAQASRASPSIERRIDDFNKQRDKVERDEMNREMVGRKPNREELRMAALKNAQIRSDLETLQAEYNEGVLKLQSKGSIDDTFLARIMEKIHESARRLRENMAFPARKMTEAKPATSSADSDNTPKSVLRALCTEILNFLTNPIIETPNVYTITDAEKARDTLDRISGLSQRRQGLLDPNE